MTAKTTTLKLSSETKTRLDNFKEFKRETYDEIIQKMLNILNLCKISPSRARARLIMIDRQKRLAQRPIRPQKMMRPQPRPIQESSPLATRRIR